jgi:ribosomal protein S27AE
MDEGVLRAFLDRARRAQEAVNRIIAEQPSFTCPRCGAESWNPNDAREGYCGKCHDWTREG